MRKKKYEKYFSKNILKNISKKILMRKKYLMREKIINAKKFNAKNPD